LSLRPGKLGRSVLGLSRLSDIPSPSLAVLQQHLSRITLGKKELTYWSESRKAWVEEPEQFDVWAGGESNAQLHADFRVVE
jgi:hypothetical protein